MNSLLLNQLLIEFKKGFYLFNFYLISLVLLFSGITKIIDPQPLIETIQSTRLVDNDFVIALSTILSVIEITLAAVLLLKMNVKITLRLASSLFVLFFLFNIYGFAIGLETDCGCLGIL